MKGRITTAVGLVATSIFVVSLASIGVLHPESTKTVLNRQVMVSQAGANWVDITPSGVSMNPNSPTNNYGANTVVVDPQTPSTVYVGTCYQGLWKSTDTGQTWSKVNTGTNGFMLDSGRLWTLAIDPVNSQILYTTAGYGNGGILKSTDGGKDWTDVFSQSPQASQLGTNDIYSIAIDPSNHTHLLAAFHYYWYGNQDSGVIESLDGGTTWAIHAPGGAWGAGNSVWVLNSSTWLVGSQNAGIWRTTNSGQSWSQVYSQNISHGGINAFYRNPGTGSLYLALWTQIVRSTDGGATWQDITSGLPYAAYESIVGDGTTLYTAPSFPDLGTNTQANGPWYAFTESGGTSWQPYSSQTPCSNGICNGPVMAASDPVHHRIYTANWNAGLWLLPQPGSSSGDVAGPGNRSTAHAHPDASRGLEDTVALRRYGTGEPCVSTWWSVLPHRCERGHMADRGVALGGVLSAFRRAM
jgi:hypothetical protein